MIKGVDIIRGLITKDLANVTFEYLKNKADCHRTLCNTGFIDHTNQLFGQFGDGQVSNTYALYGDPFMDTLMKRCKDSIEKNLNLSLVETYSYCRLYKKGSELKPHTDRVSSEYATTINLGGDEWPLYIEGEKIVLKPGDACTITGQELKHWRNPLEGEMCGQVFFFFSKDKNKKYDKRPHLGLPSVFCEK